MATLSEILDNGYIIAAHEEYESLVTWNGSATFLYWAKKEDAWENTDVQTINHIETLNQAEYQAKEWLANPNSDPACKKCGGVYPDEDLQAGKCENCIDKEND